MAPNTHKQNPQKTKTTRQGLPRAVTYCPLSALIPHSSSYQNLLSLIPSPFVPTAFIKYNTQELPRGKVPEARSSLRKTEGMNCLCCVAAGWNCFLSDHTGSWPTTTWASVCGPTAGCQSGQGIRFHSQDCTSLPACPHVPQEFHRGHVGQGETA